jgi:hypothetical protein
VVIRDPRCSGILPLHTLLFGQPPEYSDRKEWATKGSSRSSRIAFHHEREVETFHQVSVTVANVGLMP